MTRKRSTINVARVKEMANDMLANSADDRRQGREAIAVLLEHILMDTGNYRGFRFADDNRGTSDDSRRRYH